MTEPLPPDLGQFVDNAIESGRYHSEDELILAAVEALRELTEHQDALRRDVQDAITSIDAGLGQPWNPEEIKAQLRWESDSNAQAA